jgi:hypothetical protein
MNQDYIRFEFLIHRSAAGISLDSDRECERVQNTETEIFFNSRLELEGDTIHNRV